MRRPAPTPTLSERILAAYTVFQRRGFSDSSLGAILDEDKETVREAAEELIEQGKLEVTGQKGDSRRYWVIHRE